jgi:aspartate--ammonia ligase
MNTIIPKGYVSALGMYDTQKGIGTLKRLFEDNLAAKLHLSRVSAPLFVEAATGLNDNLSGHERPVSFTVAATGTDAQVVHSLAKWKRMALYRYDFYPGNGLYTDMNAIRRDEESLDNLHSVYVDQWDWEKVITAQQRNLDYLKATVSSIVDAVADTCEAINAIYPALGTSICRDISFVTTQELEDLYPDCTPQEREDRYVRKHPTTFLMQIGGKLRSGQVHSLRAPDYDDWDLNGDILFWNPLLQRSFELSSMGIRVDAESLDRQLHLANCDDRRTLLFHKMLLENKLPLTIGGGIGQSRLCMLLMGKAHIGEVQSSVWDEETRSACAKAGITLL